MRRNKYLSAALMVLAALSFTTGSVHAEIPGSDREDTWEFYIPIRYYDSFFISKDGSSVDVNGDVGWGFGFAYNFNEKVSFGFEISWSDTSYTVNLLTDDPITPIQVFGGSLDTNTGTFAFQYNILERTFTPFINVGLGWTYLDSNIPSGPPQGGCWWDPWFGYICNTWQPTHTDTTLSYGGAIGLRGELSDTFYIEGAYSEVWIDFDRIGTESLSGYRFDMGWRF